jgi:hypothetical protein
VNPNPRRPLKDGYGYDDHGRNCVEYIAQMFGPGTKLKPAPHKPPVRTYPFDPLSWMGNCCDRDTLAAEFATWTTVGTLAF